VTIAWEPPLREVRALARGGGERSTPPVAVSLMTNPRQLIWARTAVCTPRARRRFPCSGVGCGIRSGRKPSVKSRAAVSRSVPAAGAGARTMSPD